MGTGYTRNDTANNIADGNVINASDLDGEFDAVQAAFNGTTGHSHDGTSGEGPQIAAGGLASNAVTTAKIANSNVTLAKMAANSVDSDQYVDGSIDTAHIANDAVTGDKLANNIQIAGTLGVTGETTLTTHLNMGDNDKIKLGDSADLEIYHSGSGSYISDTGTGFLFLQGSSQIRLQNPSGANYAIFNDGGASTLYHNNSAKFATKSDGVDITGELECDSLDVDGILNVQGETTLQTHLNMGDNDKIKLGANADLEIYHDGSNSYVSDIGTGNLIIATNGGNIQLTKGSSEYMITATTDGAVDLYHNGSKKFETKSDGVDITGELQADSLDIDGAADISGELTLGTHLNMGDSDIIKLGASADLQIFHDGSNSRIQETGTGNLFIDADASVNFRGNSGTENMAKFNANGAVQLYHNDAEKLATTSTGVSVTGTASATTFSGDLNGTINTNTTATTQSAGNNTTKVATTAFVTTAVNNAEPFPSGTSMLFQQTSAPTGWTKQTTHNNKAIRLTTGTVGTGGSSAFTTAFGTPSVAGGSISGNPTNNHSVSAGNLSVSSGNLAANTGNLAVSVSGSISGTTLSINQIPAHSHVYRRPNNPVSRSPLSNDNAQYVQGVSNNASTSNSGGNGSHNHGHNLSGNMNGSPGLSGNPSLSGNPTLSGNVTAGNLAVGASTASINVQYVDFIIANKD